MLIKTLISTRRVSEDRNPQPRPRVGLVSRRFGRISAKWCGAELFRFFVVLLLVTFASASLKVTRAQAPIAPYPFAQTGDAVPRDVREMYEKGLTFLAKTQTEQGDWGRGSYDGPGVTGMAVMTFLASGEDPNFGIYAGNIRRGVQNIIDSQDKSTGILGGQSGHSSMYNHGFAMLALAEAYGAVDDSSFKGGAGSIGKSLELAVRGAVTSQKKNRYGGWRYGPDATDADTSVSGAVMVGLLAARNAGIAVPDEAIDRGVAYFKSMTSPSGEVAYAGMGGFGESTARTSIGTLVYAIARRKDMPEFKATLSRLTDNLQQESGSYQRYAQYYQAQALFQGNVEAWEKWNRALVAELKAAQGDDGSFDGSFGKSVDTSLSLLAMALNFRFLPIYER